MNLTDIESDRPMKKDQRDRIMSRTLEINDALRQENEKLKARIMELENGINRLLVGDALEATKS